MTLPRCGTDRRAFLGALGISLFTTPGLLAERLASTPPTTEGPFYPDKLPLDTDNDLLIVNNGITPAIGAITLLGGRILTASGEPLRNAFVEIWQCDANQSYLHTKGRAAQVDANFQGYGRFMTDSTGSYFFRTIRPVSYTLMGRFRSPHIHIAVSRNGRREFTTQFGIKGHPDNARDQVFQGVKDRKALEALLIDFRPLPGSRVGELTATFDVVMGRTAGEDEDGVLRGTIGKSEWKGML